MFTHLELRYLISTHTHMHTHPAYALRTLHALDEAYFQGRIRRQLLRSGGRGLTSRIKFVARNNSRIVDTFIASPLTSGHAQMKQRGCALD